MFAGRTRLLFLASLLGVLAISFACLNLYPISLSIELAATPGNVAQVFHSATGAWDEQRSQRKPVSLVVEKLNFNIPVSSIGEGVRFDPGTFPGDYRILSVRWQRGVMSRQLKPEMIGNFRPELQTFRIEGSALALTSSDADTQVFLPAPGELWRLLALLPVMLVVLALPLVLWQIWKGNMAAAAVATVHLGICTGVYLLSAIAYMPDLPLLDDWRYLVPGPILIVGDDYAWLTLVTNDTYFLTGQLLDFVALKFSNVDFVSVRWMGIGVLIIYLLAVRRTLISVGGNTIGAAIGVALAVGVLGQNGYWGATSLAYHQFIPVAVAFMLLAYISRKDREIGAFGTLVVVAPLCLAAGLAYISGGLIIACVGAGLLLAHSDRLHRLRESKIRTAWAITLLGLGLLLLQVWLVSTKQGSLVDHNHAVSSVYPHDRRFFIFCTALFGRAAGYVGTNISIDIALSLLTLLPAAILTVDRLWNGLIRRIPAERPIQTALPLCGIAAALAYGGAVAFGRAGFVDGTLNQPIITSVAKIRFHFCTIAAFLPLLWLGWVELAQRLTGTHLRQAGRVTAAIVALILLVPKSVQSWRVADELQTVQERLAEGAYCASRMLADPQSHQPIICTGLSGIEADIRPALDVMKALDTSVYRTIMTRYANPTADKPPSD